MSSHLLRDYGTEFNQILHALSKLPWHPEEKIFNGSKYFCKIIEVSPRSGHSLTQNLIMRAEGQKKPFAGTSRKSRPEGGFAASNIYNCSYCLR